MQKLSDNISILVIISMGGMLLLVGSFILIYVRNQNKITRQKQQLQAIAMAHQKELLYAVIQSQEKERQRIGRDLHDHVGTVLSNLRITVEEFVREIPGEASLQLFKKTSSHIIDGAIADVRNISHTLSPAFLNLYGFRVGLEELGDIINQSGKLALHMEDETSGMLEQVAPVPALSLYRVLEELLTNTIKHAAATQVNIVFSAQENRLEIDYKDNGRGVAPGQVLKKGMGMYNIESRLDMIKATYRITAGEGEGFGMRISCPLPPALS